MWSVLENGQRVLENIVYSSIIGSHVPQMSITSYWLMVLFSSSTSLLVFCLVGLLIAESRVFEYPAIIMICLFLLSAHYQFLFFVFSSFVGSVY